MSNRIPLAYADVELQLSTAIAIGGTSFSVSSANDDDGVALPAGKYCFTLDNGSTNKEYLIGQLNGTDVTAVYNVSRQGVETSGAVRAHRVGTGCIITDFATIQRVADILRGQVDLDGSSPIGYDAEPTLSDRKDLATVGYVLDIVTGGTVSFDNMTCAGNGGEAIVAGNLVYFKTSDQEWYLTDADTAATIEGVQLGIALGTGSNGVAITGGIQIAGTWTTTGLTAGSLYYAGNTAGAISASAGTTSQVIGLALSTTKLLIISKNPESTRPQEKIVTGMISMYASATPPTGFLLCDGTAVSRTTYAALFAITSTSYGVGNGSTTFNVPDLRSSLPVGYGQKTKAFTFLDANVNTSTDVITVASNKYLYTGQAVTLSTGGVLPAGLSATTYYVIYVSDTTIKLATSRADADAGTAVDITGATGGGTHTLTLTLTSRAMGDEGGEESHTIQTEELASHEHSPWVGNTSGGTYSGALGGVLDDATTGSGSVGSDTPHNNMPPFVTVNFIIKT